MPASVLVAALLWILRHPFKALTWLWGELARDQDSASPDQGKPSPDNNRNR
jgi:hypothetical protein